jgi:glycosyltransferase involved in cell wall biosynthesis
VEITIVSSKIGCNDGQGRVNQEIATQAVARGYTVNFVCERAECDLVGHPNVHVLNFPPPKWWPSRLLRDQLFAIRNYKTVNDARRRGPVLGNGFCCWAKTDVNAVHFVHSAWSQASCHPWRLKKTPRTLYNAIYSRANSLLERGAFRRSPVIVAVSGQIKDEVKAIGVPAQKVQVVHNGVSTTEFVPGNPDRAAFGLPEGVLMGLFAGDLKGPRKNLDTVLKAMVHVPSLHLAVAGRHENTLWPQMVADLGLSDRVHFVGFRRDIPLLMRSCDMFIFPSRYEACSLVILEALASGLPVLTAESTGGAELITGDVGMMLKDPNDWKTLAEHLNSLASSDQRRRAMGIAARALAERLSWSAMADRYLAILGQSDSHHA